MSFTRRSWLKWGLGTVAGGLMTLPSRAALGACGITPEQTEGPFYPSEDQADKDWDLTRVKGRKSPAEGEVIVIEGMIQDAECKPIVGALVEIWQANRRGRYHHPGDTNPAPRDPNFQYWGRNVSDGKGKYRFRTIVPGEYPASSDWIRPAHIHYKVQKRGYFELTTQLYFKGFPHLKEDRILQSLTPEERKRVIVPLVRSETGYRPGKAQFNLTLSKVPKA